MDVFERDGGATTADTVHKREEFRQIVADVQDLPETQRTALLLREIDALSYDDIAVGDGHDGAERQVAARARARVAGRGRRGAAAHLRRGAARARRRWPRASRSSSAPVRRHLKTCERCRVFQGELRQREQGARRRLPARRRS